MNTINADDVRIPRRAREAVARHEEVVILNRDRPVYVLSNPDDRRSVSKPLRRGRPLREALAVLASAPLPDDLLGRDLESIRESTGPLPADPWARS
jgi:hypothetical protein